jgi:amino-acid N-acetyltransferase
VSGVPSVPVPRPARPDDWADIARLLEQGGLPVAGAREHLDDFLVVEDQGSLIGCAGLERYGDAALLRSVAVSGEWSGKGVGRALVESSIARARKGGARELYLLTTTAGTYFARFGFETIARDALPAEFSASEQLRGACPECRVTMQLPLLPRSR